MIGHNSRQVEERDDTPLLLCHGVIVWKCVVINVEGELDHFTIFLTVYYNQQSCAFEWYMVGVTDERAIL